jgi:hypothetical protein
MSIQISDHVNDSKLFQQRVSILKLNEWMKGLKLFLLINYTFIWNCFVVTRRRYGLTKQSTSGDVFLSNNKSSSKLDAFIKEVNLN